MKNIEDSMGMSSVMPHNTSAVIAVQNYNTQYGNGRKLFPKFHESSQIFSSCDKYDII